MCKPREASGSSQTPSVMPANISKIGMVPTESINPVIPIVEMCPNIYVVNMQPATTAATWIAFVRTSLCASAAESSTLPFAYTYSIMYNQQTHKYDYRHCQSTAT